MSDHELFGSCLSVRNSSNVDTVLVSHLIVPIFRHSCSPSKFRYKVHPLRGQKKKFITQYLFHGKYSSQNIAVTEKIQ